MLEERVAERRRQEASLPRILREMSEQGRFKASVLVTVDGLPVAVVASPFDNETIAAMVALVKNTIQQAREHIGMDEIDEVSIVQGDKMRLICRYLVIGDEELILSVIAPPHQTYRRLTNRALREIKQVWERLSTT